MSTVYPSDLTAEQFAVLEAFIPPAKPGGHPRTVAIWAVLNAILYILVEGVRWRSLPGDFPPWQTVYTYFRTCRNDGTWLAMYDQLRMWERIEQHRFQTPSEGVLDSQRVKSASGLQLAVGYDSTKQIKGRKRFALVDTLGLILRVQVMAANVGEREGGKQVLQRATQQIGK